MPRNARRSFLEARAIRAVGVHRRTLRWQLLALAKVPPEMHHSLGHRTLFPNAPAEPAPSWPHLALPLGELGGAYHAGSLAPDAIRFVAELLEQAASGASEHGSSASYSAAGDLTVGSC